MSRSRMVLVEDTLLEPPMNWSWFQDFSQEAPSIFVTTETPWETKQPMHYPNISFTTAHTVYKHSPILHKTYLTKWSFKCLKSKIALCYTGSSRIKPLQQCLLFSRSLACDLVHYAGLAMNPAATTWQRRGDHLCQQMPEIPREGWLDIFSQNENKKPSLYLSI